MDILQGLNEQQQEAVQQITGPVLVLAGAGSGKTRVLTKRIAYLISRGIDPSSILAVTFTNKAADEMKQRVRSLLGAGALNIMVSTFHSFCVRVLRREAGKLGYKQNFVIYDSSDQRQAVKQILQNLNYDIKSFNPRAVHSIISRAKNELVTPAGFRRDARGYFHKVVAEVYPLYQELLKENNALDFDDLLTLAVQLFREYPLVLEYYQKRYKYILVDEYQDVNHAQYVLTNMLAAENRNLFVVGDPDQSIYGFRGADISNILNFEEDYPEARVIKLERNYRSTGKILKAAEEVISNNQFRKEKGLWTEKGEGEDLTHYEAFSDRDEASFIAQKIHELRMQGYDYNDMAILYRTNAQSRILEDTLRKEGVPYKVVGTLEFYERMEIKDVLAYLRVLYNPADDLSLSRIINRPRRGVGKRTQERLETYAREKDITLFSALQQAEQIPGISGAQERAVKELAAALADIYNRLEDMPATKALDEVLERTGYLKALKDEGTIEAEGRIENIQELYGVMEELLEAGRAYTLGEFLEEVALQSEADDVETEENALVMMTLHCAKGLEFPVVFLAGLEEGLFPHSRSLEEPHQMEEERRLCYVGITRAEERLFLTHASNRRIWGQPKRQMPSRFLQEIPPELLGSNDSQEGMGASVTRALEQAEESSASGRITSSSDSSTEEEVQFKPGDRVEHGKLGTGTVVSVNGQGEEQILQIAFPGQGIKSFMLAYAPLRKLG
ncbi:MAG: DNA helicase PcrA [Halanaerobium sp.]|nr:DNA helicase PcrA [Halanaerobium sp.]